MDCKQLNQSIEPLDDLVGATIVKDGETFKILYTADYNYTKFTIIDENFTTESFDFAPLISHVLIVKSTSKPTLSDGDTPSEILETAFKTLFPLYNNGFSSLNSTASYFPVDAPDGTAALPKEPSVKVTSASTVGFPLESIICLA